MLFILKDDLRFYIDSKWASLFMKIQIMGGNITGNLGLKSPLQNVKKKFVLFSFHFQILHKKLHIFLFNHFWISSFTNQISIRDLNPRFSVIFPPMIWIFMKSEEPEIRSKQASKRDRTLTTLYAKTVVHFKLK